VFGHSGVDVCVYVVLSVHAHHWGAMHFGGHHM
jgi:hypothetical protein